VVLHVSAASLGSPVIRPRILAAMAAVRAAGGRVSCDPNARPELMRDQEARDALTTIIAGSDILLPSTSDLDYLYPGRSETQAIEQLLQGNARIIALKRGSRGAMVIGPDAHFEFAAHPVEELDPTGAGDCFCGTFIALLTRGFSLFEAGRHANTAGALAVTRRGPMEGNTSLETIRAFLARDDRSAAYHTGVSDD
ncbi:MAG: hypothetical protein KDI15_00755, partial [Thiothrix sp.]|nr:hypothetical protein [Thiothrix sp.]